MAHIVLCQGSSRKYHWCDPEICLFRENRRNRRSPRVVYGPASSLLHAPFKTQPEGVAVAQLERGIGYFIPGSVDARGPKNTQIRVLGDYAGKPRRDRAAYFDWK